MPLTDTRLKLAGSLCVTSKIEESLDSPNPNPFHHGPQENFVPPKTWKRVLPSSGRWSFKLALESIRVGPSSSSSSSLSLPHNRNGYSPTLDGGNQQQQQQQQLQLGDSHNKESTSDDQDGKLKEGAQTQEGGTKDTAGSSPETPEVQPPLADPPVVRGTDGAASQRPPAETQEPSATVATQERGIDNWPGRAVCRDVSEKFLSWEFQDGDFCLPAAGGGAEGEAVDSCFGDMEQQREEQAAVRTALVRRQAKLWEALNGLKTNEEAGVVGAG